MTMASPVPSEALRAGRRAIDGMRGVEIVRDLVWHKERSKWVLQVRIRTGRSPAESLGAVHTSWFVLIDPWYPLGRIKVHPAKIGGLRETFPHQSYNAEGPEDEPWRGGDLCLDSPYKAPFGRQSPQREPREAHERLCWHIQRAKEWVEAAAERTLLKSGDPYELPMWPLSSGNGTVVYAEDDRTFAIWSDAKARAGHAELFEIDEQYRVVSRWTDLHRRPIAEVRWGHVVTESTKRLHAVWLRLNDTPKLPPWHAPRTWGGLRRAVRSQGVDLDTLLRQLTPSLQGRGRTTLIVGFPIPEHVGAPHRELCWSAILMPDLKSVKPSSARPPSRAQHKPQSRGFLHGYRDNALGRWMRVRQGLLRDDLPISWLTTENWSSNRIGARGRYMESLRLSRIAILGVGALGSLVADLLVRGGAEDLLLVDGDDLQIGNLVRHCLRMDSLEKKKAKVLAEDLDLTSPHARVKAHDEALPSDPEKVRSLLEDYEIIIDCTGDDAVLQVLSQSHWPLPKRFFSISVGYAARRLYFFSAGGEQFPFNEFVAHVEPFLEVEHRAMIGQNLQREGAGCWHPCWPARLDDVMLMAASASKLIEHEMAAPSPTTRLQVFEKHVDADGTFDGIRRVSPAPKPEEA